MLKKSLFSKILGYFALEVGKKLEVKRKELEWKSHTETTR